MANQYLALGELTVVDPAGEQHLVKGRQGGVLAVLLAASPEAVSSDRLLEEVWADQLPGNPETTLHSVVSRLRSLIGEDLQTVPRGYRLVPADYDVRRFEQAVEEGSNQEAANLWRGDPFRGYEDLPTVALEAERLRAFRRRSELARLTSVLESGMASEAAAALGDFVRRDPFNEEAVGLHMRALDGSGQKRDALLAFQSYADRLAEESGLEPSASLRELELAILVDADEAPPARRVPLTRLDIAIQFVELPGGARLAVGTAGAGPPLLVHPGWMSRLDLVAAGRDMRTPFWAELSKRYQLVLFDRSGTGLSREVEHRPGYDYSVTELIDLAKSVVGHQVPVLAGSGAGPIVIGAAQRQPDLFSHLILYGTFASGPKTFPTAVADSMVALVRASWGMGSDVLAGLLFPSASTVIREGWADYQRQASDAETAALLLRQMYDADVSELLAEISHPTLVIHYREDKAIPIWGGEALARGIQGARFVPLEGKSHYPPPGEEANVTAVISGFLESQGS